MPDPQTPHNTFVNMASAVDSLLVQLQALTVSSPSSSSPSSSSSSSSSCETGLVFDKRMLAHKERGHPESPHRITAIHELLVAMGLAAKCLPVPARAVTPAELATVHTSKYIDQVASWHDLTPTQIFKQSMQFDSVYLNTHSAAAAALSCGSVVEVVHRVVRGDLARGLAVVRPPGHHAEAHTAMGFCVYNNVAVAAAVAVQQLGLERVLIIDWDVYVTPQPSLDTAHLH